MRRTCISLWLTPWVVLRAISRTCGMNNDFNRAGRSLPQYSDAAGRCPWRLLLRCRDKPRRPPRQSALPRPHASRRPTRQEMPGSFFQRTRTCFVGSEIQFTRALVFTPPAFQPDGFDPAAHQSPGAVLQENSQELETFQELKPAATLNLHRCSKT
ncbi:hypothetical protein ACOTJF_07325 [Achromobacter ruhlandii]|uniref:hypothetical protein n=1 Tax=Achromobacter ruhlandii TaxID=72557 RepID=UPI003B98EF1C